MFSNYRKSILLGCAAALALSIGAAAVTAARENPYKNEIAKLKESSSLEDKQQIKREFRNWAEEEGKLIHYSGEQTKGTEIEVAGKKIRLPQDAYLDGVNYINTGGAEDAEHYPYAIIRRGNSTALVALKSGFIIRETIAPEDAASKPFQFLESQTKGKLKKKEVKK